MRISDWSSDVCSSDLWPATHQRNKMSGKTVGGRLKHRAMSISFSEERCDHLAFVNEDTDPTGRLGHLHRRPHCTARFRAITLERSEEHTSELQSLMRISYAVFCLKKKTQLNKHITILTHHDHTHHIPHEE